MAEQIAKRGYLASWVCSLLLFSSMSVFAGESDTYDFSWLDTDKKVFVLQNRKFRKKGKINFNLGAGITASGAFVDSRSYQARLGYFLMEDWGIELLYAKNDGKENSTALSVRNPGGPGSRPFRRILTDYQAAMLMWSPFYAKINTFNTIVYFDWLLGVGYAKVNEHNNREEFISGGTGSFTEKNESHSALIWETGLKFYISESFDLRLDVAAINYKAQKALSNSTASDQAFYSNYDLTLSFGVRF